jgi:hypothetical protein
MTLADLLEQALALPESERRQLAAKLIASTDRASWSWDDLDPELREDIEASFDELRSGQGVPVDEVLRSLRAG